MFFSSPFPFLHSVLMLSHYKKKKLYLFLNFRKLARLAHDTKLLLLRCEIRFWIHLGGQNRLYNVNLPTLSKSILKNRIKQPGLSI